MINSVSATQPTWPDESIPLMRVTTSGGAITVVDDLRPLGALPLKANIRAQRIDHTLINTESGTLFTNEGATGTVILTLPAAAIGLEYEFYIQANQTFTITAGSGDTIRSGTNVSTAAGTVSNNTVGNMIRIVAINSTEWIARTITGTWTFA